MKVFSVFVLSWKVLLSVVTLGLEPDRAFQSYQTSEQEQDQSEPGNNKFIIYNISMPGVHPKTEDEYICQGWKVPEDELYIVKFEALADAAAVHHLILMGCSDLGSEAYRENCHGEVCKNSAIMYAWGRNAPSVILPDDVGFRIGKGTDIKFLSIQVHYTVPITEDELSDYSGIRIFVTKERQKYIAGIYLLVANDLVIPPRTKNFHGDVACYFEDDAVLYPFAFRTHAHGLGKVISGYLYNGTWNLLGKGNPQWPQAFWPVSDQYSIKKGDGLVARCTYDSSDLDTNTKIGSTHSDEMCNFYMMYYTDPAVGDTFYKCSSRIPVLVKDIPFDSDVTLPPNPYLDNLAKGNYYEELELVDWWTTKMETLRVNQVSAVAVGIDGSVHIFHRGQRIWDRNTFDGHNRFQPQKDGPIAEKTMIRLNASDGNVVMQWAEGVFYMPHGLHIDGEGNFWVTDVALHQVMKFEPHWSSGSSSNEPQMILGEKFEPGSDDLHFCKPTDVAVLKSGEIFVSDGYCNSRIMKFSKEGKLLTKWGEHSSSVLPDGFPPSSTFDIPHSITVLENRHLVCIADRENARIQCFNLQGKFVRQIHPLQFKPRLFALTYSEITGNLYTLSGPSGHVVNATLNGNTISMENGSLINTWQPAEGFHFPHDVAVSPDGRFVYVVEMGPHKVWQFRIINSATSYHQSVKKAGASNDKPISNGNDDQQEEKAEDGVEEEVDRGYFGATIIIGGLIIVPILIMIGILIFLRIRRERKQTIGSSRGYYRRFNLGSLLDRSRRRSDFTGNDDEQRLELRHLQSDSEVEEYSSVNQQNA